MEVDSQSTRTLDEVTKLITLAKLEDSDLLPLTQVVSFTENLISEGDLKLLEVPKSLANQLEEGSVLVLRGEGEDSAVICNDSTTYDIKEAETSNSLLLLEDLSLPPSDAVSKVERRTLAMRQVSGIFMTYLELKEIRPKLRKLTRLLSEKPFTGEGEESGHSLAALLDTVQGSEDELREALASMDAVRVGGEWFILDQDYQMKVLSFILKFIDENSWKYDCIYKKQTSEALGELVPSKVLEQVFDIYSNPMEGGSEDEFSLDSEKVCRFYGDFLLAVNTKYNLDEFLEMWQKAVPDGMKTDILQLSGLVLVEDDKTPVTVRRFTEESLPETIQERLQVLFNARDRWTLAEVSPFVEPLTTLKLNVNALLTKYARPISVGGVKYFCAKHGR